MHNVDILLTMAEIAIALAGFAGVATAFLRRGAGSWPPGSLVRFRSMVENSLGAFAFSLIPLAFVLAEVSDDTTWALCSVLLAVFIVMRQLFSVRRSGGAIASGGNPRIVYFYYAGSTAAVTALLLNSASLGFDQSFTGYFLGLLWVTFHAATSFFRLIYVSLTATDDSN